MHVPILARITLPWSVTACLYPWEEMFDACVRPLADTRRLWVATLGCTGTNIVSPDLIEDI